MSFSAACRPKCASIQRSGTPPARLRRQPGRGCAQHLRHRDPHRASDHRAPQPDPRQLRTGAPCRRHHLRRGRAELDPAAAILNEDDRMAISQRRVALITGGNSGIGFATASKLAAKGFHVIMASRNQQTSARAIARMRGRSAQRQRRIDPARPGFVRVGAAVRGGVSGEGLSAARLDQQRGRIDRRQAGQLYRRRIRDDVRHESPGALFAHQSAAR